MKVYLELPMMLDVRVVCEDGKRDEISITQGDPGEDFWSSITVHKNQIGALIAALEAYRDDTSAKVVPFSLHA